MTIYELMVLVAPSVDMTGEKAQKDLVERLVGKDTKITSITSMGKKPLAYPIRKMTEATYLVAEVEGTLKADVIDKKTKIMEEVVRFLLTVKE